MEATATTVPHQQQQFPVLHELRHCSKSVFSLHPLALCPLCFQDCPSVPTSTTAATTTPTTTATTTTSSPALVDMHSQHVAGVGPSKGRCIVIKPTVGLWSSYSQVSHLHCGVSDSTGVVYNFDELGCHADKWPAALSIPVPHSSLSDGEWDSQLSRHQRDEISFVAYRPYHQLKNNCYGYVIRFLNQLEFEGRSNHSPDDIVVRFIRDSIDHYESYHNIYKKIGNKAYIVLETPSPAPVPLRHSCDACEELIAWGSNRYRCHECLGFDLCEGCRNRETDNHKRSHTMFKIQEQAVRYNCDICSDYIADSRWHCLKCEDYDLCVKCYSNGKINRHHTRSHPSILL
eukprot:TRINITY_DN6170_c0_g1_i1.p1 TRINITY_DN6170_c0_g1~~TRINITY_DN6170_c0_g1_i1.p1  ORF type:complete len:345 (-),score=14.96 TRINITY_DN6170_c0_g1_i1:259-1293(-)